MQTIETPLGTLQKDEKGIIAININPGATGTQQEVEQVFKGIEQLAEGAKAQLIIEGGKLGSGFDAATVDYTLNRAKQVIGSLAIITPKTIPQFAINMFLKLKGLPFAVQMFKQQNDAVNWLTQA